MPNFKRSGKKEMPELGTSSDIVFMFLFFFMVTSQLRSTEVKVRVRLPEATEVAKLERRFGLIHLHRFPYRSVSEPVRYRGAYPAE